MVIKGMNPATSARLRTISAAASVQIAASVFTEQKVGLLVVCGEDGRASGVISKSDLVRHLAAGGASQTPVAPLIGRPIVFCAPEDELYPTWQVMTARGLQNMPVLGADSKPLGVLDIRDALTALLNEERYEETLVANYVSGVGYR